MLRRGYYELFVFNKIIQIVILECLLFGVIWQADAFTNLGNVYASSGEFEKAEEYYNKSLVTNKKLGSKERMARNYTGLGNVYYDYGDMNKAEEFYNKSLMIYEKLGDKCRMATFQAMRQPPFTQKNI